MMSPLTHPLTHPLSYKINARVRLEVVVVSSSLAVFMDSFGLIESSALAIMAETPVDSFGVVNSSADVVIEKPADVQEMESDNELLIDQRESDEELIFLEDLTDEAVPQLAVLSADDFNAWQGGLPEFPSPYVSNSESEAPCQMSIVPVDNAAPLPAPLLGSIPGLRDVADPGLELAGTGHEKQPSEHNDRWATRRADALRSLLRWDMRPALGDLPLAKLDELFSHLFARAVKVDGTPYPSATLMGMMNALNRVIRRASVLRSLAGLTNHLVERDFNINSHPLFQKTRLVLNAAIRKSAKDGINKKRKQVRVLTEAMEAAVLSDMDHSITTPHGCQKRLAFYCLVRLGIRGGLELWNLKRQDMSIELDKEGKEYVRFEERESKNNNYTLERYSEEQFRNVYHSYEPDFVLCVQQYYRHLPPLTGETKPDLFLGPITNPATEIWYNKTHKVARDRAGGWLKTMLRVVGLPDDLMSNKSGRATLITRMASRGVPDQVGMLISGHRTVGGYERYDRTKALKIKAATLVSARPDLTYEMALQTVAKDFVNEDIIGKQGIAKPLTVSGPVVTPLLEHVRENLSLPPVICTEISASSVTASPVTSQDSRPSSKGKEGLVAAKTMKWHEDNKERVARWHKEMDFDLDEYDLKYPDPFRRVGTSNNSNIGGGNSISGSHHFQNCTIIFNAGAGEDDNKENIRGLP